MQSTGNVARLASGGMLIPDQGEEPNSRISNSSQQIGILQEAIQKSCGMFYILLALQTAVSIHLNIIKYSGKIIESFRLEKASKISESNC